MPAGFETLVEPSLLYEIGLIFVKWCIPFGGYFFGVVLRKKIFPVAGSPSLFWLLMLAIPVCLVVVSPLLFSMHESFFSNIPAYLFTLGIIIEHGMIAHETAIAHIKDLTK